MTTKTGEDQNLRQQSVLGPEPSRVINNQRELERFYPATDRSRWRVPQPNIRQNSGSLAEKGEKGSRNKKGQRHQENTA